MRTIFGFVMAALLVSCGAQTQKAHKTEKEHSALATKANDALATQDVPNIVIVRVKGHAEKPADLTNAEVVAVKTAKNGKDITDAAEVAELFAQGKAINVATSLEQDDTAENSSQSWFNYWYGGYGNGYYNNINWYPYGYGYGAGCGYATYGCGYTPAYYYGAYAYPAAYSYYSPYYYGGYSYYSYCW